MITLKQFFEKYLSYFILAFLIFISFYEVISNLMGISSLKALLENNSPSLDNYSFWSLITTWCIELVVFSFVGITSIIVLVKSKKISESNRLFVLDFSSFSMSIIIFQYLLSLILTLIEFSGSSAKIDSVTIFNMVFLLSIFVLLLLSYVIKFKSSNSKFILSLIAYFISFLLFFNTFINQIITTLLASSLISVSLISSITFVLLSLVGIVFSSFYMAINCTREKISCVKVKKETSELEKKLSTLKQMFENGYITQEDYETTKNELLKKI